MIPRLIATTVCLLLVWVACAAPEANTYGEQDRQLLLDAGVPTDAFGLQEFFQKRTLTEATRRQLVKLVQDLGDEDFDLREKATKELLALGPAAEPTLLRAAADKDAEIATRARQCLEALAGKRANAEVLTAGARLLAALDTKQAVAVLLAYLPSALDEIVEEELAALLGRIGVAGGQVHPALIAAAQDAPPVRRIAAAEPLARAGGSHRDSARKLLQDPDARVRLYAARALIAVQDRSAVPTLITLLGDAPLAVLWHAEDQLCRVAGEQAPQILLDPASAASRQLYVEAWKTWWRDNEQTIDLSKTVRSDRLLGLTVVCDFDGGPGGQGRIWEYDAAGKVRWKIEGIQGPADVHVLPTGRLLIAEHSASRVTERTRDGKIVWEHAVTGNPISVQRLTNGHTFIATYTELLQITREGTKVYSYQRPHSIYGARRLASGHLLYIHSSGHIVELDPAGKEVRSIPAGNTSGWGSVELLPNGRFLVALYGANKVREIDANGKVYLDCAVPLATFATRLSNGNTLTADTQNRRILEFDALGKEVARQAVEGRPFCVRRR